MIYLERDDLDACAFINGAFPVELLYLHGDPLGAQLLVVDADLDIVSKCPFEMGHEGLGPGRANHPEWFRARAKARLEPTGEPDVGDADRVVGAIVRKQ